jgi:hypothetical protein
MNTRTIAVLTTVFFLLTNSDTNKAAANDTHAIGKKETSTEPAALFTSGNELVGKWKLSLEVPDTNENKVPDEDEVKKGFPNNYQLQLNADGSCRIQQVHTGRYETIKEKGDDMLKVYRKRIEAEEDTDPLPDIYRIVSVKKEELVLQVIDGGMPSSFWFFKRIG